MYIDVNYFHNKLTRQFYVLCVVVCFGVLCEIGNYEAWCVKVCIVALCGLLYSIVSFVVVCSVAVCCVAE